MKKLLALLCTLLALTMLIVSCDNKNRKPSNDTDGSEETEDDTSSLYDKNGYLKDSIPDSIDYGGEVVSVIGWKECTLDFSDDTESGDTIANETFYRNEAVMDRLNISLEIDTTIAGDNANRYTYVATVEQNLLAGVKYDLIACYSMNAANFAMDGYVIDLQSQSDALDFSKPWWSSNMLKSSTVNNKLYFASGSISATSILQTMVMWVNMEMIDARGLQDPRGLAGDGEWTMAKLFEMCANSYVDTNALNEGKDSGDTFGLVMFDSVMGDAFLASNGLHYLSADGSGKLEISSDFKSEKTYNLMRDLIEKFKSNDFLYETAGVINKAVFIEERAIFIGANFDTLMRNRSLMEFDYGYLPYPKADEEQEEYYTASGFPFTMWCIPLTCKEPERAAYVMECLASEGYRSVQPEIYQKIKYRGNDDPINAEMFDLIIESKTYDMGRIFHNMFEWKSSPVALFRERMYKYDNLDWYSALATESSTIQEVLDVINTQFGY